MKFFLGVVKKKFYKKLKNDIKNIFIMYLNLFFTQINFFYFLQKVIIFYTVFLILI